MRRFLIYLSNSHERIFKAILIFTSVVIIASLLPHRVRYKFDVKIGKVWQHEDLAAPFDFPIFKDPDSLQAERSRVVAGVFPYYVVDTVVFAKSLQAFNTSIENALLTEDEKMRIAEAGEEILVQIYSRGIIRLPESEPLDDDARISLVREKYVFTRRVDDFLTTESALNFLDEQAGILDEREAGILKELLAPGLEPNIFFDRSLTEELRQLAVNQVLPTRGMIPEGELIIAKGQVVNQEKYALLQSLRLATGQQEPDKATSREIYLGQLLVVAIALSLLMVFLALLRKDIFANNRKIMLMLLMIVLIVAAYTGTMKMQELSNYVIPLCILPIVLRVFFDTRLALFTHVITVLILGSVAPNGYEFAFMQIIAGMVTIFSITNLRKRAHLFIAAGMIFMAYLLTYTALTIIQEGTIMNLEFSVITWLAGNVLLTLFSYPLVFIFEKVFGLTSDISLMELTDSNSPLLRELSVKAPGTFQHSLQVANLAEAAAYSIGANTLLVRVGALYHDIGKMEMPLYFIENQSTGINPHDDLSFEESASIIISHVIRGIEKARKHKLPDLVIDFIRTHHGTSMVQYFYQSFLKNYPEQMVDEDDFRYPGPLPFNRETAVLMMADSVEAASRSLTKPDADSISHLVDHIIDDQISQQQFVNSDITFRDISTIKKILKKMLRSMYHVRVEYPGK